MIVSPSLLKLPAAAATASRRCPGAGAAREVVLLAAAPVAAAAARLGWPLTALLAVPYDIACCLEAAAAGLAAPSTLARLGHGQGRPTRAGLGAGMIESIEAKYPIGDGLTPLRTGLLRAPADRAPKGWGHRCLRAGSVD